MPAGTLIVPGAEIPAGQKAPRKIFPDENAKGVNASAQKKGQIFQHFKHGRKQAYASVNGKHPEGSAAKEPHIALSEGIKGGKDDFKTPSEKRAFKKIF